MNKPNLVSHSAASSSLPSKYSPFKVVTQKFSLTPSAYRENFLRQFILTCFIFLFLSLQCSAETVKDDIVEEFLQNIELEKPLTNTNYNYDSFEKVQIKLKISEKISTKKDGVYDGQPLVFYSKQNVKYNGKTIIHKGDKFNAVVETYMNKGMNGIPAVIIVDKFSSNGIDPNKIKGLYIKKGLNLSLMVFPLKWALTPIPGVGSLTNFILGGNASITQNDNITLYYYPNWN